VKLARAVNGSFWVAPVGLMRGLSGQKALNCAGLLGEKCEDINYLTY
jgi:hypothetical protein